MKLAKSLTVAFATLLPAAPALAHDGDHSATLLANIAHWLSSPTHSLFAVIGGVIISALIVKAIRKSNA